MPTRAGPRTIMAYATSHHFLPRALTILPLVRLGVCTLSSTSGMLADPTKEFMTVFATTVAERTNAGRKHPYRHGSAKTKMG